MWSTLVLADLRCSDHAELLKSWVSSNLHSGSQAIFCGTVTVAVSSIFKSCARAQTHMSAQPMINYSRKCPGASAIQISNYVSQWETLLGGYRWQRVKWPPPLLQLSTTTSHRLSTVISPYSNSSFLSHMSSISDMSHSSSSSSFQSLFKAALQDYANRTGTKLDDHPIAEQVKNCDSVDSISSLLQDHARKFSDFRGEDGKIMKSVKRAVHVLDALSTSTALGEGIGLVCQKSLIAISCA